MCCSSFNSVKMQWPADLSQRSLRNFNIPYLDAVGVVAGQICNMNKKNLIKKY